MFTLAFGLFLFGLIAALAGGWLGASIGANYAFSMVGFTLLAAWGIYAGTGSTIGFDYIAFGPFLGPHIAFGGGVAAAAYANRRGWFPNGRDVSSPLAGLGRPSVLLVGALFGAGAYLAQIGIAKLPFVGSHTDSIALTVVLSNVAARLMFGGGLRSVLHRDRFADHPNLFGRIAPQGSDYFWLKYQEKPVQYLPMGAFFGIAAGAVAIALATFLPRAASLANTFPFAISAIIILFLILGHDMPVQHHITNIAGLAAVVYLPIIAGSGFQWGTQHWTSGTWMSASATLIVAALFGMVAAWLAEIQSNLFHHRGDTHIDPPAMAIWVGNSLVVLSALLFR